MAQKFQTDTSYKRETVMQPKPVPPDTATEYPVEKDSDPAADAAGDKSQPC